MMAVTIAAGLDGVNNKLEPPPQSDEKTVDKMPRYIFYISLCLQTGVEPLSGDFFSLLSCQKSWQKPGQRQYFNI